MGKAGGNVAIHADLRRNPKKLLDKLLADARLVESGGEDREYDDESGEDQDDDDDDDRDDVVVTPAKRKSNSGDPQPLVHGKTIKATTSVL